MSCFAEVGQGWAVLTRGESVYKLKIKDSVPSKTYDYFVYDADMGLWFEIV